jgi:hypothetical protein
MSSRKRRPRTRLPAFDPGPSGRFAARLLREANVPGAVIGRMAVWTWLPEESEHAFTKDLDVAVNTESMPFVRAWLATQGLKVRELSIGGVNVSYPNEGVNVDIIDRASRVYGDLSGLFRAAIAAASESGETVEIGDASLNVVPPEHLVAMKLATGEDGDEADAIRLIEHVDLDVALVRDLVRRHLGVAAIGRMESLLRRLNHPAALPERPSSPSE